MANPLPVSINSRAKDPDTNRAFKALEQTLNREGATSQFHIFNLPGVSTLPYFLKANTGNFENWYPAGQANATALTTLNPAKDVLIAVPFVAQGPWPVEGIGLEVTTGAAALGKARVGIYASKLNTNGQYYPGTLILDSGQFDATAVQVNTLTDLNITLTEGALYFAAYLCGTNNPTIRGVAVGGATPALGLPATISTASGLALTVASTYSANGLPNQFPGAATVHTTAIPGIFLRYAPEPVVTKTCPIFRAEFAGMVLRRGRLLASSDFPQRLGLPYFTMSLCLRRGTTCSVLGTYDSRANTITAGEGFSLTGAAPLDRVLLVGDQLELSLSITGRPMIDLENLKCQVQTAYAGS